jgi:hypothetical protein
VVSWRLGSLPGGVPLPGFEMHIRKWWVVYSSLELLNCTMGGGHLGSGGQGVETAAACGQAYAMVERADGQEVSLCGGVPPLESRSQLAVNYGETPQRGRPLGRHGLGRGDKLIEMKVPCQAKGSNGRGFLHRCELSVVTSLGSRCK